MNDKETINTKKIEPQKPGASRIFSVGIYCEHCQKTSRVEIDKVEISTSSQECDICGSHGTTTMYVTCPKCSKHLDIVVKDW